MKSSRHLSSLQSQKALIQKRQASPGERVIGSLFPNRGVGWYGSWSSNRAEEVQHLKNWCFVAIDAIASQIASTLPNFAYLRNHHIPGRTQKAGQRSIAGFMDDKEVRKQLQHEYRKTGQYNSNLLSWDGAWGSRSSLAPATPQYSVGGSLVSTAGHSFLTVGAYKSKALSVVKPHEELEPLEHNHDLRRLIENPNPVDTSFDLLYESQMFQELCGVSYLWAVPNVYGQPCELWTIPSHWVWPRTGGGKYVSPDNEYADNLIQYYEIRPWGTMGSAGMLKFPPDQIIMERWKSPINKIDGFSKLSAIAQWIDSEESIGKSRWAQFQNQARPEFWVDMGDIEDPSDDRLDRISAKFMARYQGEYNFGKPIFTHNGAKVTPLSFNPTEMSYYQSEEQMRDMILSTFRVPPAVVGIVKDMTYGSLLGALSAFCSFCINHRLAMRGLSLTKFLASRFSTPENPIRIWWDDCVPTDPAQVNSDIATDISCQAITPNEVRAIRGRKGYEHGGDDPMVSGPGGMVPLPLNTGDDLQDLADLVPTLGKSEGEGQEMAGEAKLEAVEGVDPEQGHPGDEEEQSEGREGRMPKPEPEDEGEMQPGQEEPGGKPHKMLGYNGLTNDYKVKGESFFENCERDDKGHCISGSGGGASGSVSEGFSSVPGPKLASGEVAVSYDPEKTSAESAKKASAWLSSIPKSELLKSTAKKIEVFENPEDMDARLREGGIDPGIEENGQVRGAFDFDTKTLYASTWNGYSHDPRTLLHEMGHSILGMDEDAAESWAQAHMPKDRKQFLPVQTKSLTPPVAAGLALMAADSGRVLMIQRGDNPEDNNHGKWEFPGGKIDGKEYPSEGAEREWTEEVGLALPDDYSTVDGWDSGNGKYQGFIRLVPTESSIDLFSRDTSINPDGDTFEAVAWIDPDDMMNHNLRPELLMDLLWVRSGLVRAMQESNFSTIDAAVNWCIAVQAEYDTRNRMYYGERNATVGEVRLHCNTASADAGERRGPDGMTYLGSVRYRNYSFDCRGTTSTGMKRSMLQAIAKLPQSKSLSGEQHAEKLEASFWTAEQMVRKGFNSQEQRVAASKTGLTFNCPSCGKPLGKVPFMESATQIIDRQCRNPECEERWRIKVVPVDMAGGMAHSGTFTFLGRSKGIVKTNGVKVKTIQGCTDPLPTEDIRQTDHYSCGAASAMICGKLFGVGPDTLEEWKTALGTDVEQSTSPQAIVDYLEELGLHVEAVRGMTIEDLNRYFQEGKPVICPVQDYGSAVPDKAEFRYGHYLTVIGVGLGGVLCQDSSADNVVKPHSDSLAEKGRVLISNEDWDKAWHDEDVDGNQYIHYGIVVGPKVSEPEDKLGENRVKSYFDRNGHGAVELAGVSYQIKGDGLRYFAERELKSKEIDPVEEKGTGGGWNVLDNGILLIEDLDRSTAEHFKRKLEVERPGHDITVRLSGGSY